MKELEQILQTHYGLKDILLTDAPRGFVAETYRVETDGNPFFAKIIPVSRYSSNLEKSLTVLAELRHAGVEKMSYPIPTTDGRLSVHFEDKVLALFNYIDGLWTFDYDFERYVDLIAQVHAATPNVHSEIGREGFTLKFKDELLSHLHLLWSRSFSDPYQTELQTLMLQYRAELLNDLARVEELAAELQRVDLELVITHGDAPGNIVKTEDGDLYLIDWDDVLLAPRERDTWFHLDNLSGGSHRADQREFLRVYRKTFPDYNVNWKGYDYYLLVRYFDDLEGFIANVLSDERSDEQKAWNMDLLRKDWLGWLRPLVRMRYP